MKINSLIKYIVRFLFLQVVVSYLTIWYFDNYLIFADEDKYNLYLSLVEDRNRFVPFIPVEVITVDLILILIVFLFLVVLYSTKFYTYVNELDYSYEKSYLDEYFSIYLLWNSFLFSSFLIFRFSGLSRGNLLMFTFLVPLVLLLFRNSELLSTMLGRSIINENFITFNLNSESIFRNLRIMSFRKNIENYFIKDFLEVIKKTDEINKILNINLVVINFENQTKIEEALEKYLLNLNKKILLISKNKINFNKNFIYREEFINDQYFVYFNNDIQYGSKFILKRITDLILGTIALFVLTPFMLLIYFFIILRNGFPGIIKQDRVK